MKIFFYFLGFSKEEVNYKGTNVLQWIKSKKLLTKELILEKINGYQVRGSKPAHGVKPYNKWQRILKNLEKYDQNTVAAYNIYLAFIFRYLQIIGKTRIADS